MTMNARKIIVHVLVLVGVLALALTASGLLQSAPEAIQSLYISSTTALLAGMLGAMVLNLIYPPRNPHKEALARITDQAERDLAQFRAEREERLAREEVGASAHE